MMRYIIITIMCSFSLFSLEPRLYYDLKNPDYKGNYIFTLYNEIAYVNCDDGISGMELWVFNGDWGNTHLLKDINPNGSSDPTILNSQVEDFLLFSATDEIGRGIWSTDGTEEGTKLIMHTNYFRASHNGISHLTNEDIIGYNGKVYFVANDDDKEKTLWVTDGTPEGTHVVFKPKDNAFKFPFRLQIVGEKLVFLLGSGYGDPNPEVWSTDGTTEGTIKLADRGFMGMTGKLFDAKLGDKLIFPYTPQPFLDIQLWVTDGTVEGTKRLDEQLEGFSVCGDSYTIYDDKLYFCAKYKDFGTEPWVTDGTEEGTYMLEDLNPDGDSKPAYLINSSATPDKLVFLALTNGYEYTPIISDGTTANTRIFSPNSKINSNPDYYLLDNDNYYFINSNYDIGNELWVSDFQKDTTYLVKDIAPGKKSSIITFSDIILYGSVIFSLRDDNNLYSIWKSDGSEEGTYNLDESLNKLPNKIGKSEIINGVGYFSDNLDKDNNTRLWRSDMTKSGSAAIEPFDATIKQNINYQKYMLNYKNNVYFFADYTGKGHKLYRLNNSVSSVEKEEPQTLLTLYPNPAEDFVQINISKPMQLSIISSTGSVVKDCGIVADGKVQVSELSAGVYFIVDDNGNNIAKFVKE